MPSLNTKLATAPNVSANYVLKATTSTTIGNSLIFDNGTNVAIGTTTPLSGGNDAKWLTLDGTSYGGGIISSVNGTAKSYSYFDNTSSCYVIQGTASTGFLVRTDNTERLRITSSGNVGIGTNSPVGKLDINTGANSNIVISNDSVDTGYNIVSLNGTRTKGSYAGIAGGGTGDNNLYLNSGSNVIVQTGGSYTQRMTITSSGNVGIGTTSPNATLSIYGATTAYMNFRNATNISSTFGFVIEATNNETELWNYANGYMRFGTNNTERIRITSGGFVAVGLSSPSSPLDVYGVTGYSSQWRYVVSASAPDYPTIRLLALNSGKAAVIGNNNDGGMYFFVNGTATTSVGTTTMTLTPAGDVSMNKDLYVGGQGYKPGGGSWANSSDIRLKENVKTIDNALDKVLQLRGVTFDWKEGYTEFDKKQSAGFIADEIMEVFPEWVNDTNANDVQKEIVNDDKIKSLSLPFHFDALLVEAIKELNTKLQDQQQTINSLINR